MAINPERVDVEHIRAVVVTTGFTLGGYVTDPTNITITLIGDIANKSPSEISISEMQIKNLLATYGWEITGIQTIKESMIVTAQKKRTLTSIR